MPAAHRLERVLAALNSTFALVFIGLSLIHRTRKET